ncbi:hypothetical protein [Rhizorhapis suberifaciens]|uniref:DUF3108 domain-containing protein n=1 Tax=Rhizorhapis suberifaciens TaxID=13656 RepID=A0A840HR12_9SPHN|nr:hypothetical protein [Rhizorhapis suberifaciens]MBB4640313.1 hypothetical protein [Rhizorhapis suberifaciens]
MIARRVLLAFALLAAPPLHAAPGPKEAGRYRLTGVQDAASELELTGDGHFRYYLIYGALDEMAEGVWRREGKRILLTTQPAPVPPKFILKSAATGAEGELSVAVTGPDGQGIAGVDVQLHFDDQTVVNGYTQEEGWRSDIPKGRKPTLVTLSIPMFGVRSPDFSVPADAYALQFLLEPNDMGTPDFRDLPLEQGQDGVEMLRDGARLRYERVK